MNQKWGILKYLFAEIFFEKSSLFRVRRRTNVGS